MMTQIFEILQTLVIPIKRREVRNSFCGVVAVPSKCADISRLVPDHGRP
jgi:hypothetical protein